jgi:hypothetical protein
VEEEAHKLHYCLRGICPRIDISFLQKHKLKGNITKKVGDLLWNEVSWWMVKANEAYTSNFSNRAKLIKEGLVFFWTQNGLSWFHIMAPCGVTTYNG